MVYTHAVAKPDWFFATEISIVNDGISLFISLSLENKLIAFADH